MYNNNNFVRKNDNDKQGQQQGREPLRLKIDKFDEFKSTVGTSLITSMKLTKKINGLFRSAGIADFYGTTLRLNESTGQLELSAFFKPSNNIEDGRIYFAEPAAYQHRQSASSAFNRIASLNSRNAGRTIQISQDGKDVFEELIFRNYNQKIDWNRYATEVVENGSFNNYNIYLKVQNIDINKVLKKIWGDKAEDGSRLDYQVSIARFISGSPNMVLSVQQLNEKVLNNLAEEIGIIGGTGSLGIVR